MSWRVVEGKSDDVRLLFAGGCPRMVPKEGVQEVDEREQGEYESQYGVGYGLGGNVNSNPLVMVRRVEQRWVQGLWASLSLSYT